MFVVTLPPQATNDPTAFADRAKKDGASFLEVRGDLTPDVPSFSSSLPIIVTPRKHYELLERMKAAYVDLDIKEKCSVPQGTLTIRSHHDFERTPSLGELRALFSELHDIGGDVVKIATMVQSCEDIVRLEEFRKEYQESPHVILGMGIRAHLLRLRSPLHNALTYTYLEEGQQSALGQVPLDLYRHIHASPNARVFGLLGGPDVSSFSPLIHNALFSRHGIDGLYALFLTDDPADVFRQAEALGIHGLSVTAPYKQKALSFVDSKDSLVEELGSVNTLVREKNGWKGYCTDVAGIAKGYPFLRTCTRAAILGSGGVVPSVIRACRECGIGDITVFARNQAAREALSSRFGVKAAPLSSVSSFPADVVVCAVSSDDHAMPLPKAASKAHAIDLRYGAETHFLLAAREAGFETHDGLAMLLHQALAQFTLFTGIEPDKNALSFLRSLLHHGKQ